MTDSVVVTDTAMNRGDFDSFSFPPLKFTLKTAVVKSEILSNLNDQRINTRIYHTE